MIDLTKYPRMAAMLARNPDRKPATPIPQLAQPLPGRVRHFASEQDRLDHEQYVSGNSSNLPF